MASRHRNALISVFASKVANSLQVWQGLHCKLLRCCCVLILMRPRAETGSRPAISDLQSWDFKDILHSLVGVPVIWALRAVIGTIRNRGLPGRLAWSCLPVTYITFWKVLFSYSQIHPGQRNIHSREHFANILCVIRHSTWIVFQKSWHTKLMLQKETGYLKEDSAGQENIYPVEVSSFLYHKIPDLSSSLQSLHGRPWIYTLLNIVVPMSVGSTY